MRTILVQVYRDGEWRRVSSVEYEPNRQSVKREGNVTYHTRASAEREAHRILTAWLSSHQFYGCQMRVGEVTGWRSEEFVPVGGWRAAA